MRHLVPFVRSRAARRAFNIFSVALASVAAALTVRHFLREGWPIHHANAWLVVLASALFLVASGFKAWGWQRLFASDRPRMLTLLAAGGAASVGGVALPGRFDEVLRIAVVRRCPRAKANLRSVALSLFLLGLLDSAALTPLASVAAVVSAPSTPLRIGFALVAAAGIGAAGVILLLPRIAGHRRLARFPISIWLGEHSATPREAGKAWAAVTASWCLRGLALFVLLHALGLHGSFALALAVLCAGAASAALPVAPAGAATQAGAGAAVLMAAGVSVEQAVAFAVAAQALLVFAGLALLAAMGTDVARSRLRVRLQP